MEVEDHLSERCEILASAFQFGQWSWFVGLHVMMILVRRSHLLSPAGDSGFHSLMEGGSHAPTRLLINLVAHAITSFILQHVFTPNPISPQSQTHVQYEHSHPPPFRSRLVASVSPATLHRTGSAAQTQQCDPTWQHQGFCSSLMIRPPGRQKACARTCAWAR